MRPSSIIPRIAALALAVLTLVACARPAPAAPDSDAIAKAPRAPTPVSTPTQGGGVSAQSRDTLTERGRWTRMLDSPKRGADPFEALSQLSLGYLHACGLREDGRAVCVNLGTDEPSEDAEFSAISSGRDYSCGLRKDGAAVCWGNEWFGETRAPEGAFSALSAGKRHACALDADGAAVCWGWNSAGRAAPPPWARFVAITAGGAHSCGIAEFGNLVCWGKNDFGQSEPREGPFAALALGSNHTCALRTDGSAFCQGNDSRGQASPPPTEFVSIAAGVDQTCGITPEGGLECWGINPLSNHSEKFASVSVGYDRICALTVAGAPMCHLPYEPREDPVNGASLASPVEMFPLPSGGVAVVDRSGYVEIYPPEGSEPRIALDLTARTRCCDVETGMFSASLDPDFDRFPFIYIYWQTGGDAPEGRVSRFPMTRGGDISESGELVILRLPQPDDEHFGGALRFGADGMMYLGLGECAEGEKSCKTDSPSADLSSLGGKIIRIDVRGSTESAPYRIPSDNPFADTPGARPEIWALGLRNPWRMSFLPNGDLIVADVGEGSREELSIAARGANLGWPMFEGSLCLAQDAARCDAAEGYTFPIYEYPHKDGNCAIIGGMAAPDGKYIFGDFCDGRAWSLEQTAPDVWSANEITDTLTMVTAFGSDADSAVYALTVLGPVARVSE